MLDNMKYSRIVLGDSLEAYSKGLIIVLAVEEKQLSAALFVSCLPERSRDFLNFLALFKDESVQFIIYIH